MQGLETPEWSHLSRASAERFTRAYVEVLIKQYPWPAASEVSQADKTLQRTGRRSEREIPQTRLPAVGWLVAGARGRGMVAWELQMRSLGLVAGDLDDSKSHWAVERRKIAAGDHDGVAIVGGSRILFDTNLDVWQEVTGRRPVQLALPGMSGQRFLADLANHSDFAGLVLIDVTPEQFFREGPGNPEFEGVLDYWEDEGPAERFGHRIGLFLSRHLAFLDDQYSLGKLIDQLDIPNRGKIVGPYLRPWKLSENFDGPADLPVAGNRDERAAARARHPGLAGRGSRPPPDEALIARICADVRESVAKIRARGGEVVFIRPPSTGAYYEREQAQGAARQRPGIACCARRTSSASTSRTIRRCRGSSCRSCRTSRARTRRDSRAPTSACYVSGT